MAMLGCQTEQHGRDDSLTKLALQQAANQLRKDTINWDSFQLRRSPKPGSYAAAKRRVAALKSQQLEGGMAVVGQAFENALLDEIIPHWYGTDWDFNGYTDTPGEGVVACGYFVSTTLKHAGLQLNRYKLAQQSPAKAAAMLKCGDAVLVFSEKNALANHAKMLATLEDGICFVGLGSSHVGYLLKRSGKLFFIHSSYFAPSEVTIELASQSPVFCAYDQYYIVKLSNNATLMKHWLAGSPCVTNGSFNG